MSRASGLAGFSTSISPPANLSVGVITASSLTVGGVTVSSAGVVTATSFSGSGANLTGISSVSFATTSFGLSGSPIISVSGVNNTGVSTSTDLRLSSIADKTTIVSGNSVSLSYSTGGGNVAICTNPSGPITLNVTDIPTDSSFNNRAISFAVIAIQTATAYACTSVTLNGVSFGANATAGVQTHIAYASGTVALGSTTGYDVFNFTGINTTGSASTTLNYKILSNVSGGYRRY